MRITSLLFSILFLPVFALASGKLSLQGFYFPEAPASPAQQFEGRLQAEYDKSVRVSSRFVTARINPFIQLTTHPEAWNGFAYFDPKEVNLTWKKSGIFARAGYFTLLWEGTDGLNPMDIASMKNFGDPLNPLTRASLGLHLGLSKESFDFEVVWIPQQTESQIPGDESAWWPRRLNLPLRTEEIEARLPDHVDYLILDRQEDENALENNFAGRIKIHGDLGDAALAFFEGASETPIMQPTLDVVPIQVSPKQIFLLQSPVRITPIDYRRQTTAGFLSTTAYDFVLRAASRYDQPMGRSPSRPSWSQQSVAGIERSIEIGENTVTGILQFSWIRRPESVSLLSIQDLFDKAVLAGIRWPVGEDWTFYISGMRSGSDKSFFAQTQAMYRVTDALSTELSIAILDGPEGTLLGTVGQNDRASLKLTYAF